MRANARDAATSCSEGFGASAQTLADKGYADAGSLDGSAVWRISKLVLDTDDDLVTTYADGDTEYNNIWTNRLSLSYS